MTVFFNLLLKIISFSKISMLLYFFRRMQLLSYYIKSFIFVIETGTLVVPINNQLDIEKTQFLHLSVPTLLQI